MSANANLNTSVRSLNKQYKHGNKLVVPVVSDDEEDRASLLSDCTVNGANVVGCCHGSISVFPAFSGAIPKRNGDHDVHVISDDETEGGPEDVPTHVDECQDEEVPPFLDECEHLFLEFMEFLTGFRNDLVADVISSSASVDEEEENIENCELKQLQRDLSTAEEAFRFAVGLPATDGSSFDVPSHCTENENIEEKVHIAQFRDISLATPRSEWSAKVIGEGNVDETDFSDCTEDVDDMKKNSDSLRNSEDNCQLLSLPVNSGFSVVALVQRGRCVKQCSPNHKDGGHNQARNQNIPPNCVGESLIDLTEWPSCEEHCAKGAVSMERIRTLLLASDVKVVGFCCGGTFCQMSDNLEISTIPFVKEECDFQTSAMTKFVGARVLQHK